MDLPPCWKASITTMMMSPIATSHGRGESAFFLGRRRVLGALTGGLRGTAEGAEVTGAVEALNGAAGGATEAGAAGRAEMTEAEARGTMGFLPRGTRGAGGRTMRTACLADVAGWGARWMASRTSLTSAAD